MPLATTATPSDKPDLTACDREPIHAPGTIQPHGVLVATYPDSRRFSHVSANCGSSLGVSAAELLEGGLDRLFGPEAAAAIENSLGRESYAPSNVLNLTLPIPVHPRRKVVVHRHLGRLILELEGAPFVDEYGSSLSQVLAIISNLRTADTTEQLYDSAVRQMRQLTGYDRVMIYRFDDDGHGTVVAEDKAPGLEPLLNLRYPSTDIPQQARRMYVLQRVRAISDVDYVPVPLLWVPSAHDAADGTEDDGAGLDMTFCALRGISPVHIEYLRNMGVKATLVISLLQDAKLWGMIVCHHGTPLYPSADMRGLCDIVGQLISVLLVKVAETEELAGRLLQQQTIAALRAEMEVAGGSVAEGLLRQSTGVLALMGASGALIRCGGSTCLIGEAPPIDDALALMAAMRKDHGEEIVALADAGVPGGLAASFASSASGILLMPILNNPGDAIAWFRPEVVRTVQWGGDPNKQPQAPPEERISPRKSFAAWTEQLRGHSVPWTAVDLHAAVSMRRAVTGALLRSAEQQLAQLSAYDSLTGLPNRSSLEMHMERWRTGTSQRSAALLSFDIDRFKTVNDTLGRAAGDELLVQVAARLRHFAPAGSTAGRLGGDEFAIFWPGAEKPAAEMLAGVLLQELARPFRLLDQQHYASASLGVSCASFSGHHDLMREADAAMYAAKRQGGSQAAVFQPELHTVVLTNMQTEQELFRAVENSELEIHYQPLVTVPQREVCGFEALLRWRHRDRGWVSPSEFIPRAEESGLITRLGAWVLAGAVRQIGAWRRTHPGLTISINVSPRQLTEGSLSTFLADVLAKEEVPATAICLEVTEGALMQEAAVAEIRRLRGLGVTIAVDDFGTGYSSLAYLLSLPVDSVKIDRSFVAPLGSSRRAGRFFSAIVDLAQTIDLETVAEGCETEEQWKVISAAGCGKVQGWLVSRAMNAADANTYLEIAAQGTALSG